MPVVLLTLCALLSAMLYIVGLSLDLFWLKLLTKPWPVLALGWWVWQCARPRERPIAWGLFAGALGDICLALPNAFLPGMIAFAVGHALYVVGFVRRDRRPVPGLLLPVAVYAAIGLILMLPGAGALKIPLVGYVAIIALMIWRAAACAVSGRPLDWLPLAGALLFAFSDTLIGIHRFATPLPGAAVPIILTYWAGQTLIAISAIHQKSLIDATRGAISNSNSKT